MREQRVLVTVTGVLLVAAGAALAVVVYLGEAPPLRTGETVLGALAFGALVAAPGVLALVARRGQPALLLPAAIALVPLSMLSLAGVLLPLLVPAVLLVRACARATPPGRTSEVAASTVVVVALLVAAVLALFLSEDPRRYETATGAGSSSDVVSYAEALLSLTCTALAVAAGRRLAPRVTV